MSKKTIWITVGMVTLTLVTYFLTRRQADQSDLSLSNAERHTSDAAPAVGNELSIREDSAAAPKVENSVVRPAAATTTSHDAVFLRSQVSAPSKEIQQELIHVDPTVDDWDTEAFSDRATQQLKLLEKTLREVASSGSGNRLDQFLHDDFRSVALRPAVQEPVYQNDGLAVTRWSRDPNVRATPTAHAADGLLQALEALVDIWRETHLSLKVSFKIVRVSTSSSSINTRVLVQLSGPSEAGYVQQNAVWTCAWRTDGKRPLLLAINVEEFEEITYRGKSEKFLADSSGAVMAANKDAAMQFRHGIDYWRDRLDWRLGLDIVGPHGLAVGDVNGDGADDVFVCEPGGLPNRLLVQQLDGTVRDVSAAAGVDWLEPATSALFVDMDNDGDQDLVFTSGRILMSCENDGSGVFQRKYARQLDGGARSISAADYDADGNLDIYICCYFHSDSELAGIGLGLPIPYHDANNGPPNVLLRNVGNWDYEDVTKSVGLDVNNRRFSFAAAWEDFDNDGDTDLYVANDFGRNNLFRNDGGKFVDVAAAAGIEDVASGMSVSWADYNRDGHMDLYVGNMYSSAGNRITYQSKFRSTTDDAAKSAYRRLARGNSLFQNNGDGTFRDVSLQAGVNMGRWAWGCLFADLNNDGWEDLLVGNGMITSVDDPGDL